MTSLFFYGTLRHPALLKMVLGHCAGAVEKSALAGHVVCDIVGQNFPIIVARVGQSASGVLLRDLSPGDIARLDYYEGGFGYDLRDCIVETDRGRVSAKVYFPKLGKWQAGDLWSLSNWAENWGDIVVATADEFMDGFGQIPADVAAGQYAQMMMRAGTRLRAAVQDMPRSLRQGPDGDKIDTLARRRPYSNFFTVEEHDMSFPRFNSTMSPPVTRAALVGGDAVTVLPYDPVRDRVMVIEQFRFAPHLRGDRWPWTLEPIAGRIDPGETPQQAVHREMAEEVGITVSKLLHVADYYPSPGAWTEYLFTYVGIADLPDSAAGVGGLASEGEDIKSHVLSFAAAMDLISSGEADTGPLILTLLWLQARRDAIRRGA